MRNKYDTMVTVSIKTRDNAKKKAKKKGMSIKSYIGHLVTSDK